MPDFDANEDQPTLPTTGQEHPAEPTEQGVPAMPRAREDGGRHRDRPARRRDPRVRPVLTQSRRVALRACDDRGPVLRPLRRRRRLWTVCHGRAPGSSS
jgi:hypothetical protein